MKQLIVFLTLIFINCPFGKAQNDKLNKDLSQQQVYGTYQLQMINSRNKPYIPENIKQMVIDNRKKTSIKYIRLGTEVRLMILPESEINKKEFKPLPLIGYVNE